MVLSTRIMKKPRQSANSARHASRSGRTWDCPGAWLSLTTTVNTRRPTSLPPVPGRRGRVVAMSPVDLMAGPPPTHLPPDPATELLAGGTEPIDAVRRHPASPAAWAALATDAVEEG